MSKGTVNKVILLGRLGKDPEVRMTASNTKLARVSLATNETFRQNGELQTITDWHSLVFWGNQADFAEKYLKKGMLIFVEGKLRTRQWQDRDGNKRYTTEVIVDNSQIISGTGQRESGAFEEPVPEPDVAQDNEPEVKDLPDEVENLSGDVEDDIPF